MTPKEKAKQLLNSYREVVRYKYHAKFCALVGIEESLRLTENGATKDYLQNVKIEIEKIIIGKPKI